MWLKVAGGVGLGAALLAAGIAAAAEVQMHKRVGDIHGAGGIDVYYGLAPAKAAAKHPRQHTEGAMHGGAPRGRGSYHLTITLKDPASGKYIEDARVAATVRELNTAGKRKKLEPMRIDGTMTYGNYFVMKGEGPYRIDVSITPAGATKPIEASFEHKMPGRL